MLTMAQPELKFDRFLNGVGLLGYFNSTTLAPHSKIFFDKKSQL
jgi:hypothetical protein